MSWLYLPEAAADYTEACCSDTLPSALLNFYRTTETCSCSGSVTACSRDSPCGMTFALLTATLGADASISSAVDSPVRTLAQPEKAQASTVNEAGFGGKWRGSFAKYSPALRLWKTAQCSLLADSDEFSETWPRWGSMRAGECWEVLTLGRAINETGFGLLPTPQAMDATTGGLLGRSRFKNLRDWMRDEGLARTPRDRNARFWEFLMMWPDDSTGLKPLEMDKFRLWLQQHGECLEVSE